MPDALATLAATAAHEHGADERELSRARARTETRLTPAQLLTRSTDAVGLAMPWLSTDERDDLASDLRMAVVRRLGTWEPRDDRAVSKRTLALKAVTLARDLDGRGRGERADRARGGRGAWRDVADPRALALDAHVGDGESESDAVDPAMRTDALKCWLGDSLADDDARWQDVADALGVTPDSQAGDAVRMALNGGRGTSVELAAERGSTPNAARQRLDKGRKRLARMYPTPDALADALADAGEADRPMLGHVSMADARLGPVWARRYDRDVLTGLAPICPTLVGPDPTPRIGATARKLRRVLDTLADVTTYRAPATHDPDPRTTDGEPGDVSESGDYCPTRARAVLAWVAWAERHGREPHASTAPRRAVVTRERKRHPWAGKEDGTRSTASVSATPPAARGERHATTAQGCMLAVADLAPGARAVAYLDMAERLTTLG